VKLLRDRNAAPTTTDADGWKSFWKEFSTHEVKWLTPFEQTFADLGTTYSDAKALLDENSRKGLEEIEADFRSGASIKNEALSMSITTKISIASSNRALSRSTRRAL
jgi:hypothetical protein